MEPYDRLRVLAAAQSILDRGGWCVLEFCTDVPRQRWEGALLMFDLVADVVADAVADEIAQEPTRDARLTGCDRRTLRPEPEMGAHLCYLAESPVATAPVVRASPSRPHVRGGFSMLVRDAMNPIVVTVEPDHTLREAARRMTARGVGAAVVIDDSTPGPGILTERDILHSSGVGEDVDIELVREHVSSDVVYVAAGWSLERAAAEMVSGGFRHVIVLDGPDVTGILSMRDVVRCWTSALATDTLGE